MTKALTPFVAIEKSANKVGKINGRVKVVQENLTELQAELVSLSEVAKQYIIREEMLDDNEPKSLKPRQTRVVDFKFLKQRLEKLNSKNPCTVVEFEGVMGTFIPHTHTKLIVKNINVHPDNPYNVSQCKSILADLVIETMEADE